MTTTTTTNSNGSTGKMRPPRTPPRGVRRMNGGRIALAAGGAAAVALLALAYGLSPNERPEREPGRVKIDLRKTRGETINPPALSLPPDLNYAAATKRPAMPEASTAPAAPSDPVASIQPVEGDAEAAELLAEVRRQNEALRERINGYEATLTDEATALKQLEEQRRASRDAPIGFASITPRSAPAADQTVPPMLRETERHHVESADASRPGFDLPPDGLHGEPMRENLQREKVAFLDAAERQLATYLPTGLAGPVRPTHELAAGSVIPGFTVTGINTDLPGKIVGRVSADVYDSATGRHVLVPQGSVAVGEYSSLVSNGQNRVLIAWELLTFPDGRSLDLRRQPGVDAEGFAGLADRVDYHWDQLLLAGGVSTAVAIGGQLAEGDDTGFGGTESVAEQLRELTVGGASDTAARIANKVIDRQLDVQPTITVRPGWRFNILLTRNLVLEPYVDSRR